jgi:hypothetical protein
MRDGFISALLLRSAVNGEGVINITVRALVTRVTYLGGPFDPRTVPPCSGTQVHTTQFALDSAFLRILPGLDHCAQTEC